MNELCATLEKYKVDLLHYISFIELQMQKLSPPLAKDYINFYNPQKLYSS